MFLNTELKAFPSKLSPQGHQGAGGVGIGSGEILQGPLTACKCRLAVFLSLLCYMGNIQISAHITWLLILREKLRTVLNR